LVVFVAASMMQTSLFVHEIIAKLLHICHFCRPYYAPIHAYNINQNQPTRNFLLLDRPSVFTQVSAHAYRKITFGDRLDVFRLLKADK